MSRIAIVTDSTASIPDDLIDELDIHWVPYHIHKGQRFGETWLLSRAKTFTNGCLPPSSCRKQPALGLVIIFRYINPWRREWYRRLSVST